MKVGIFGGTFNPVHNGHLIMLDKFISSMNIEQCYVVPAAISPFKTNFSVFQATDYDRLFMLKLALKNFKNVEVLDYEIVKGGVSYTIDTINFLKNIHPEDDFYLLIGADQAIAFDKWKNWEEIIRNSNICIVRRPDIDNSYLEQNIKAIFNRFLDKIRLIVAPIIDITATQIREKLKNKESISGLVPEEVEEYNTENKLYIN
ncbi:MAG TPA: nicotinate (nicotinamide) nucleotide adenylyltransferase [Candidatus Kapabacteria bacterium]|nr:nicotinate (nicotinamide) nucleotide adenylyltransferase [Candidatus Kapabacteria bacterium]